ncbi:MAG: metal-dependent hydrolase [Anaerolineae bacterium]|jgi:L-ascorbate metabolism protein UlaG (beta-lactamase superfamily)|nr:metal-dependent hydrolase [Anaerolineae bacterium]MBT3714579.1 metal-dependent hydrolase [Anaerolineae bacterium]MBT4309413.1 metal-dependent hydrolase [Anaerolineae bacterium]MBT4458043.1 metal-dependent hydrolase [Anaerolineae bacterium]MBT4843582.1 metal-dependent hydrolase [Anaerolineae bacterium]
MNKFTWYGHATLGLETDGHKLLIDPFFTDNPSAPVTADEMEANFILVSHGHGDHVGDTVSIAERTDALVISNFEIANWFETQGVSKVHPQHLGGGFQHPFGYLKLTLALHGSALPDGSYGGNPAGFLLTTNDGKKIYMAQDTGLFGDMQLIGDEGIDLAVIPIGDNFTMGPDDALKAVKFLRPKVVIPIHYNTWDLIAQNPISWADRVEDEMQARVVVLAAGESFEF